MANAFRKHQAGFTLVELIIVIVVIGVLSVFAAIKSSSTGPYTALSQAQTMASNLRHAQTLASTLGKRLSVKINTVNNTYSVSCVTSVAYPCNPVANTAMTNPVTGSAFTVALEKNVSFLNTSTGTLLIDSWGMPVVQGATYQISVDGSTAAKQVIVAAVTGFVSIP